MKQRGKNNWSPIPIVAEGKNVNGSFMPALKQLKDKAIKANYG